jgi:hypothetical protein
VGVTIFDNHFQQYFCHILAVSLLGTGNWTIDTYKFITESCVTVRDRYHNNRICDVMVSCRFRIRVETQVYYICYLLPLAKTSWLGIRIKWSDIANRLLLFQLASTINISLSVLVQ